MSNPTKSAARTAALAVLAAYGLEIGSTVSTDYGYGRATIQSATLNSGSVWLETDRGGMSLAETFKR